ncbi:MAG: hypothetical protein IJ762_03350 [Bacteroidaceae bacterium]|nr:hypothetical protein [Bacteroidaceae bacterium]
MDNQQNNEGKSGLSDKLHNLFSFAKPKVATVPEVSKAENPENRRIGETYEQWGTRICGIVSGSMTALPPYLHKVFNYIYNEQAENVELQKAARANTQAEIERKNDEIRAIGEKIEGANSEISDINKHIAELKAEREEIKSGKEKVNKDQRLKLIIGLFIIIPLTFYLFLFYSSTFYSAFFRDPSSMTNAMNAMFDSNALANAYNDGIAELGFVLSAPIIFLGLGFALHFFSVQEGKVKYLKMLAILLVTVMFDCILAYKIGDQMHTFGIIIGEHPIGEEYTVSMAIHDINTWAVIFCGFIVYVIWGIVFDMCMSAYDKMDFNKTQLEHIKNEIASQELRIKEEKENINALKQQEADAKNKVQALMAKLGHEVYIDYAAIRTEMNNFFAGWIKMMQVLSLDQSLQDEASNICKREMGMLIKN